MSDIRSFNFRYPIFSYHGAITVTINGYVLIGIMFEEIGPYRSPTDLESLPLSQKLPSSLKKLGLKTSDLPRHLF